MAPSLRKIFSRSNQTASSELSKLFCLVEFLDNTDPVKIIYQANTKGQFLLDYVSNFLDLVEKEYFGLRFVNSQNQQCWLDATKLIQLQLKDTMKPTLYFRVRFYPPDPLLLKEEITRYFLFLQVRKDLERGRLVATDRDICILTAYIMQEELGDYDEDIDLADYKMAMPNMAASPDHVIEEHRKLRGINQSTAESLFLQHSSQLASYAMDPVAATDSDNCKVFISLNHNGLHVYKDENIRNFTKWSQIRKFTFEGHNFVVHPEEAELKSKSLFKRNAKSTIIYKCNSTEAAKHLWKQAVAKKLFFNLNSSTEAPKLLASGGRLRKSSKFRYSGLCLKELTQIDPHREEPNFSRNTSKSGFTDPYGSPRTSSLPRSIATTSSVSNDFTASRPILRRKDETSKVEVQQHPTPVEESSREVSPVSESTRLTWTRGDNFHATIDSGVDVHLGSSTVDSSTGNASKSNSLDSRASTQRRHDVTPKEVAEEGKEDAICVSEDHTPVNSPHKMALLDPRIYALLKDLQTDMKTTEALKEEQKILDEDEEVGGADTSCSKRISRFGPQKKCLTETDRPSHDAYAAVEGEVRSRTPSKEPSAHEEALNYHYKVATAAISDNHKSGEGGLRRKFSPLIGAVRNELTSRLVRKQSNSAKELRKFEVHRSYSHFAAENQTSKANDNFDLKMRSHSTDAYLQTTDSVVDIKTVDSTSDQLQGEEHKISRSYFMTTRPYSSSVRPHLNLNFGPSYAGRPYDNNILTYRAKNYVDELIQSTSRGLHNCKYDGKNYLQMQPVVDGVTFVYERSDHRAESHLVASNIKYSGASTDACSVDSAKLSPEFDRNYNISENVKPQLLKSLDKTKSIEDLDKEGLLSVSQQKQHATAVSPLKEVKRVEGEKPEEIGRDVVEGIELQNVLDIQTTVIRRKSSISHPVKSRSKTFAVNILKFLIAAIVFFALLFFFLLVLNQEVDLPFSDLLHHCPLFDYVSTELYAPSRMALGEYLNSYFQ